MSSSRGDVTTLEENNSFVKTATYKGARVVVKLFNKSATISLTRQDFVEFKEVCLEVILPSRVLFSPSHISPR